MKKFMEKFKVFVLEMTVFAIFAIMVISIIYGCIPSFYPALLISIPAIPLISFLCFAFIGFFSKNEAMHDRAVRFLTYGLFYPILLILFFTTL